MGFPLEAAALVDYTRCTCVAWPGLAWPGLAGPGLAWPGQAWPGLARPSLARLGLGVNTHDFVSPTVCSGSPPETN